MARNLYNVDKEALFLDRAHAQLTACWSLKVLQERHDYTCNNRCKAWRLCRHCPVDAWAETIKTKIESGTYDRSTALKALKELGTEPARELYEKLTRPKTPTVIHYNSEGNEVYSR